MDNLFHRFMKMSLTMPSSLITNAVEKAIEAQKKLLNAPALTFIESLAQKMADCYLSGHKILIAGNGGSLCDASHFAEELTGQFRKPRKGLPAIALNDPGFITCTGNDFGFDYIFSRGVESLGKPGDLFIGLTTSGNSKNIILAFEKAKKLGLGTVSFLGKKGGSLKGVADLELLIEGFETSDRIQEAHMSAIHIAIEAMEHLLFYQKEAPFKEKSLLMGAAH